MPSPPPNPTMAFAKASASTLSMPSPNSIPPGEWYLDRDPSAYTCSRLRGTRSVAERRVSVAVPHWSR